MGEEDSRTSDFSQEVKQAKAYLEKHNEKTPGFNNLYDQLTQVVKTLLNERPNNTIDILEQYVKRLNIKRDEQKLSTQEEPTSGITEAEAEMKLFQRENEGDGDAVEAEEDFDIPLPDMMELAHYFEQAGFGLGRQEMYRISLALRQLAISLPLTSVRFWGKIFGTKADYIIAEVEYREGEEDEEQALDEAYYREYYMEQSRLKKRKAKENKEKYNKTAKSYKRTNKKKKRNKQTNNHDNDGDDEEFNEEQREEYSKCTSKWCVRCGKVIWRSEAVVVTSTVDHDQQRPIKRPLKRSQKQVTNFHEDEQEEVKDEREEETQEGEGGEDGDPVEEDNIPQSTWKPPPEIPAEAHHNGTNKKVYFVCNKVGGEWKKLPHVTPTQIAIARQIKKLVTGDLDAPIVSYPPFPGNEGNYLRAQIARISAGSQISPAGFYTFDEEEEEEDDEEGRNSYTINPDFDGLTLSELIEPTMSNWVHHVQSILPQGRCTWFNPSQKQEDDFEDDDMDEDMEDEDDAVQPEVGPPLLSSVSEDRDADDHPAWTVFLSSRVAPKYSLAVARSNHWPGAVTFAKGRKYENVYIGFGLKYAAKNYSPPVPPVALDEYPVDEAIIEMDDPTVEEENALKQAEEDARREAEDGEGDDDEDDDD